MVKRYHGEIAGIVLAAAALEMGFDITIACVFVVIALVIAIVGSVLEQ